MSRSFFRKFPPYTLPLNPLGGTVEQATRAALDDFNAGGDGRSFSEFGWCRRAGLVADGVELAIARFIHDEMTPTRGHTAEKSVELDGDELNCLSFRFRLPLSIIKSAVERLKARGAIVAQRSILGGPAGYRLSESLTSAIERDEHLNTQLFLAKQHAALKGGQTAASEASPVQAHAAPEVPAAKASGETSPVSFSTLSKLLAVASAPPPVASNGQDREGQIAALERYLQKIEGVRDELEQVLAKLTSTKSVGDSGCKSQLYELAGQIDQRRALAGRLLEGLRLKGVPASPHGANAESTRAKPRSTSRPVVTKIATLRSADSPTGKILVQR